MYGKGPFGKAFDIAAQVVNGHVQYAQEIVSLYLFIKLYLDVLLVELILNRKLMEK